MDNAPRTDGPYDTPGPWPERPAFPIPAGITEIISLVHALTAYGSYLAKILHHPNTWTGFSIVAQYFGTIDTFAIAARVQRGLMRLAALEQMLLRRAQTGRDVFAMEPRERSPRAIPTPVQAQHDAPQPKPARTAEPPRTVQTLPSQKELDAQVHRSSIGQTITAICLDLGVSPSLCEGLFWNRLFDVLLAYRGNLVRLITELRRRKQRFEAEYCDSRKVPWPEGTRDGARNALGFFIGVMTFPPIPAATAGPS